ncbi:MFS transporter [Haloactinospora alba]|uniref:MFS transporter n=1 Tax=Haloactinospora alba TaxID=405555 RepID=A0A543NEH5_9ACTN|nr:MFS transporter [Haloactinospora alba]TQN30232.1 MFS transporter [Haloactinospora alba]
MASEPPDRNGSGTTGATRLGGTFTRFWTGSLSSNLADGIMLTALPMVAAMLTNDPLLVSGLTVARFLPWLLVGLFVGVVVDRLDRARVMVVGNALRCMALVALAVAVASGSASVWVLYAVMFTVMLCEVFYDVSVRAMLPDVVPTGALDRANARMVGGRTVTEDFAGAPLAGFLFAVTAAVPLAVNAGAYLLSALVLLGLPLAVRRPRRDEHAAMGEGGVVGSAAAEMGEGLRFVWGDRPLLSLVLFLAFANMALMAQTSVIVLLVRDHFGVPESLYGVFMSSSAVGGVLGAVVVGRIVRVLGRFRTEVLSFGVMAGMCVVFGLSPNAVTASLAWGAIAFAITVANVVGIGVSQLVVPGSLLGRVASCMKMISTGTSPLGAVLGGFLGRVDLRLPSLAAGGMVVLGLLLAAPWLRSLVERADEAERAGAVE